MAIFSNQATLTYNGNTTNSNIAFGEILDVVAATKTAIEGTYTPGALVTYVITLRNTGNSALTDLTVTDDLGAYEFEGETVYPLPPIPATRRPGHLSAIPVLQPWLSPARSDTDRKRAASAALISLQKNEENGRAVCHRVMVEVRPVIAAVWLMLSGLMYSLQLSTGSFPKPLTRQEEEKYLALAAQGDLEARNILIERNLRLVAHIMKKYYAQTADQEDLISIGTIGLIKGITTFDHTKGARLATYAARCVENEILMYFRAQKKSAQDVSLSDYIETGNDGAALQLMDVVSDREDLLENICYKEDRKKVCKAVDTELTDQEKQVILLRYGLGGGQPQRQREVAKALNISRSYVSRIEKRALEKLRRALE